MLKISKIKDDVVQEHDRICSTGDLKTDLFGLWDQNMVKYEDLNKQKQLGSLLSNRRVNGKLYQVYTKHPGHQCIVGSTRSGKTTGLIIPQTLNLAQSAEKPSIIETDPKGELYAKTAVMMRNLGYDVRLLNFRDYRYSDSYNILQSAFDLYVNKGAELKETNFVTTKDGRRCLLYDGKIFESITECRKFIADEEYFHRHLAFELIHDFVVQSIKSMNQKDPFWDSASRDEIEGYIIGLLEDVDGKNPKGKVTRDNFNMATVKMLFEDGLGKRHGSEFLRERPDDSIAKRRAGGYLNAPDQTRNSIESVLSSHISHFGNVVEKNISLTSTFSAEDFISQEKPAILYIIFPDEKKSGYEAISLFIADFYSKLVRLKGQAKVPTRDVHFILDEFGNMPVIEDFDTQMSVSAGRGIYMTLVLQSYCQLEKKYPSEYGTILDNIATTYFLSSNNYETQQKFSRMCGTRQVLSPIDVFGCSGENIERCNFLEMPVVPVSQLSGLEEGEIYIKSSALKYVLKTYLERYYNCPEYICDEADIEDYKSTVNIHDKKYTYQYIKTAAKKSADPFDLFG
ncbi:MAG: type IV secretory system conjugative DNA transfer family protein [Bacillota bacterium]